MSWIEPKGRYFLPNECEARTRTARLLTETFRSKGFSEVVLPTLIHAAPGQLGYGIPSDRAYRFLDRQGNLLMLRPDMTPVVARFAAHMLGTSRTPLRFYYQGSVFRSEDPGGGRRDELFQVGCELFGAEEPRSAAAEMAMLAVESLLVAGTTAFQMQVGHQTLIRKVLSGLGIPFQSAVGLETSLSRRDYVAFDHKLRALDLPEPARALAAWLAEPRDGRPALERIRRTLKEETILADIRDLEAVYDALSGAGLAKHVHIDLGLIRPFEYYSGIVVEGYAVGAGLPVLGGGAYSVKKPDGSLVPAFGFALDVDALADALAVQDSQRPSEPSFDHGLPGSITIALPAGRLLDETRRLLKCAGIGCGQPGMSRSLVLTGNERIRVVVVRPSDVPTYVEQGAADLGVAGEDVLAETRKDVCELLDLRAGVCRLVVAAPYGGSVLKGRQMRPLRIATKYPVLAADYFESKGIPIEIIRLSGAIEVAPLAGLADAIVDITSSGRTLNDNGLVALDEVLKVTARLIGNRASLALKRSRVSEIVAALRSCLSRGGTQE